MVGVGEWSVAGVGNVHWMALGNGQCLALGNGHWMALGNGQWLAKYSIHFTIKHQQFNKTWSWKSFKYKSNIYIYQCAYTHIVICRHSFTCNFTNISSNRKYKCKNKTQLLCSWPDRLYVRVDQITSNKQTGTFCSSDFHHTVTYLMCRQGRERSAHWREVWQKCVVPHLFERVTRSFLLLFSLLFSLSFLSSSSSSSYSCTINLAPSVSERSLKKHDSAELSGKTGCRKSGVSSLRDLIG